MPTGLPIQERPDIDTKLASRLGLGKPELYPTLSNVLADCLRIVRICLWPEAFGPYTDQWQKGNAAMRIRGRALLKPGWYLQARY